MPEPHTPAWRALPYAKRFPILYGGLLYANGSAPTDDECLEEAWAWVAHVALQAGTTTGEFEGAPPDLILSTVEGHLRLIATGQIPPPPPSVALAHPIGFN